MEAAELIRRVEAEGCRAALLPVEQISFDPAFRRACEQNTCGNFGKCWKCPPDAGPIEELIREAQTYDTALVLQTIGTLEDSFDFEGMMEAAHQHGLLLTRVRALAGTLGFSRWLLLGAGGLRSVGQVKVAGSSATVSTHCTSTPPSTERSSRAA